MNKIIKYLLVFELFLIFIFLVGSAIFDIKHYQKQYSLSDINPNFQINLSELGLLNNSEKNPIRENLYTSID